MRTLLALLLLGQILGERGNRALAPVVGPAVAAPLTRAGNIGACLAADGCVLDCRATETAWECLNGDGADSSVVQGVGTTYEPSGYAGSPRAIRVGAAAQRPTIAAGLDTWVGDHTIVVAGSHTGTAIYFQNSTNGALNGARVVRTAGFITCSWGNGAAFQEASLAYTDQRWALASCRRSGGNYITRANGTQMSAAITQAATTGVASPIDFGANSGGNPMNGPLAWVRVYSRALADAELARIEAQWWGAVAEERNVTVGRASTAWVEGDDGQVYPVGHGAPRVTARGILGESASTNSGTNSLDVSAWAAQGTPAVLANQASGPFARMNGGAEMDRITDDDAGVLEGYEQSGSGTTAGAWTYSVYVSPGTVNEAALVLNHNGTGPAVSTTACTFTGLNTTTPACGNQASYTCSIQPNVISGVLHRIGCTTTVTGTPAFVRGQVRVGDAVADQGTIFVAGGQLEAAGLMTSPIVTTSSALQRIGEYVSMPGDGIPRRGEVQFAYTPRHPGGASDRVLLSLFNASGNHGAYFRTASVLNILGFAAGDGAGLSHVVPAYTFTPYVATRVGGRWSGTSVRLYVNGTDQGGGTFTRHSTDHNHAVGICNVATAGTDSCIGWIRNLEIRP